MAVSDASSARQDADPLHEALLRPGAQGDEVLAFDALVAHCEALPRGMAGRDTLIRSARAAVGLSASIRQHQLRERGLLAVSDIAATLTPLRPLHHVLEDIVGKARQLLGSHIAWLAGLDREQGTTFVIAIEGAADPAAFRDVEVKTFRPGQLGRALDEMRRRGITEEIGRAHV